MSTRSPSAVSTTDSADLEALFDSIAAANRETDRTDFDTASAGDVVCQIGQLTRRLHDSLGTLGYDGMLQNAAHAFPDACERLAYVASMAEQSAVRCLTAIEAAKPLQDTLSIGAHGLAQEWDRLFQGHLPMDQFRDLALRTRDYLGKVPAATDATNAQLTEIMMAQDFQDLTGQVIKKITGLLNGPVIYAAGCDNLVTSQAQVDELLESLGFSSAAP